MDNTLAKILGAETLPKEILVSLQEAFDQKLAEMREETKVSIREEFAVRYEHDKATLVEAIDRMLSDEIKKNESEKKTEINKLKEAKNILDKSLSESKKLYQKKMQEHITLSQKFIVEQLAETVKSLNKAKKDAKVKSKKLDEAFEALKTEMAVKQDARLKKIDEFVVRNMKSEIKEFDIDRRALNETRVKLIKESKEKIKSTQKRFVKEAAEKVEAIMSETLQGEMAQLHKDIESSRQNMFGRRIFEAVAAEYMTSYLAEGTEIRKLQVALESKNTELSSSKKKLNEAEQAKEIASRKVKLAEDRASRTKIMTELLSNLRGDKRSVMETMLESTKTDQLRATFDRYLPVVLNETTRKATNTKPNDNAQKRVVSITGDKTNRLFENVQNDAEDENVVELASIIRLAGIKQ